MAHEFLTSYLNDHFAGSQMALGILDLLRGLDDDSTVWQRVTDEIQADRQELERLMRQADATPSTVKRATAWAAGKLTELKVRVEDPSDGALRRLELIEALALGIDGKHALWTALRTASQGMPQLTGPDYEDLIARAEKQRSTVEVQRLQAAADALGRSR